MFLKLSNNNNFKKINKRSNLSVQSKKVKTKSLNVLKNHKLRFNKIIKTRKIITIRQRKIKRHKMLKSRFKRNKVQKMTMSVYSIKSHCKLYVWLIFKRFALNVRFLANIKAMTLKALSRLKNKTISFIIIFLLYTTRKQ